MLGTCRELHNIEHEMNFPRVLKAGAEERDKNKRLSANNPEPTMNMSKPVVVDLIISLLMACLYQALGTPADRTLIFHSPNVCAFYQHQPTEHKTLV